MNQHLAKKPFFELSIVRWGAFSGCWALVAIVWLWLLPSLSQHPQMREMIRRHRAAGINAGAMVYTELGAIRGVELEYRGDTTELREFRLNRP